MAGPPQFCSIATQTLYPPPAFRPITPTDGPACAALIRDVMRAVGLGGAGYSIHDPEVDDMYAAYRLPRACYYVCGEEASRRLLGGGGIAPLIGGSLDVCELRKMYFRPELRGRGAGRALLHQLIAEARELGYAKMYLESRGHLAAALRLYERFGFVRLAGPMGATGHEVCDVHMALALR